MLLLVCGLRKGGGGREGSDEAFCFARRRRCLSLVFRMVVVCAGVKSILDIPRTLEYLETQGVAVMCWQTDQFPAFFTVDSGEKAPIRVDKAEEVSDWIQANKSLSLTSGAIVAVPNPEPADEATIQTALDTALHEVKEQNIQGKAATPYLLQRINELTGGGH